jgi:putative transposase
MAFLRLRPGQEVAISGISFTILRKLESQNWQLENRATGELRNLPESELLALFSKGDLTFSVLECNSYSTDRKLLNKLNRDFSTHQPEIIAHAQQRLHYLKAIEKAQPISMTPQMVCPIIATVAEHIGDPHPPSFSTVYRNYRNWIAVAKDIRATIPNYMARGNRIRRWPQEVSAMIDSSIQDVYMTPERRRMSDVHAEIHRRITRENQFRATPDKLPIPSQRSVRREISGQSVYELVKARYGKRRAEMDFRVAMAGPRTSRPLQRVEIDHTPADLIVVDERTMMPLGRPTITSALDAHTRCVLGFYAGFEPPSVLAVMRCLKNAILPKTYLVQEFPAIKNPWDCYGVPELVVVDNAMEFHSTHFERACLQLGCDIQYSKVSIPWYKAKIERWQGTLNRDSLHGNPVTTFSNILDRGDYDPMKNAVVLLSTFREILHRWIVDHYQQSPHRGIHDTPAHMWLSESQGFPPPLPPAAKDLEVVLGMTAHRTIFHYGIELHGLKYNSLELGEIRRRIGTSPKATITFDPGDLGYIYVLDPKMLTYLKVPCIDQNYSAGLSLWQHRVVRRNALRLLQRTDIVALAQVRADISELIERDLDRKSLRLHKRHARFQEGRNDKGALRQAQRQEPPKRLFDTSALDPDETDLPIYEADLNLPHSSFVNGLHLKASDPVDGER